MIPHILSNLVKQIHSRFILSRFLRRSSLFFLGGLIGFCVLILVIGGSYYLHYQQMIFPGVMLGPVQVGELTKTQAADKLNSAINNYRDSWPAKFELEGNIYEITYPFQSVTYNVDLSVAQAFNVGRRWSLESLPILFQLTKSSYEVPLSPVIDEDWLNREAASLSAQIDIPLVPPRLEINPQDKSKVDIIYGHDGRSFNHEKWKREMETAMSRLTLPDSRLFVEEISNKVTTEQLNLALQRAQNLVQTELKIEMKSEELPEQFWTLDGEDLVKFVTFENEFNTELINEYVTGVAEAVNRPPKDAKLQFDENSGKVSEFVPAEDGIEVNITETTELILNSLKKLAGNEPAQTVSLSVNRKAPDVPLSEVNRLGIKERIGVGKSTYKGSILSRVHNVELAAARINGTLIKPGEEFSFNQAVGDISAATGYQAAYVIKNGRTELGDGGGVCQDSTTVFRAALNAGLPITARKGHAYRVGYYEQDSKPGLDATVYAPSPDLKFLNDTPGHILIQTHVDSPNRQLTVILYGTSDGRKSTIKDHIVWDVTPPPPDVYVDDPTLPVGTVKQIDWKAAGAKTKFTYLVERDGQIINEKTFVTNFQPWAAVYLKGTKPL